ncbi:unnamed protein product [Adineta steineri]|uniref:Ankyrin repeat protein n=1 Tax=Adineta steineri TaxID=433720 RepID=A0A818YKF4_9BILA|nr:unnamed protein product [Adineta steineri]CAF3752111.1 unnamed protein product [Adineta steineri]
MPSQDSDETIEKNDWNKYIEAVRQNNINLVGQYIKCGGDLNYPVVPQGAIHCAVYFDFIDIVKLLLEAGINVNQQDEDGDTALHYAVGQTKNIECIKLLLHYGACPLLPNNSSEKATPITVANRADDKQILDILTENVKLTKNLCKAAEDGNVELVQNLLETTEVSVNGLSDELLAPIHEASLAGHLSVVKLLIEFKANINAKVVSEAAKNNTPLHCAATNGHLDIIKYLIENHAINDTVNSSVHTPLLGAVIMEKVDVAEYLIRAGSNVHVRDSIEKTPLHWAAFYGLNSIVLLLLEHGADINALDHFGQPPIHCAVGYPIRVETIKLLIEKGAKVNIMNDMGMTIFDYCVNNTPDEIDLIEFIRKRSE